MDCEFTALVLRLRPPLVSLPDGRRPAALSVPDGRRLPAEVQGQAVEDPASSSDSFARQRSSAACDAAVNEHSHD